MNLEFGTKSCPLFMKCTAEDVSIVCTIALNGEGTMYWFDVLLANSGP